MEDDLRKQCYELLFGWHARQYHHPLGPSNRHLYDRVEEVLKRENARFESVPIRELISLANEIRDVSGERAKPMLSTVEIHEDKTADELPQMDDKSARVLLALLAQHPKLLTNSEITAETDFQAGNDDDETAVGVSLATVKSRVRKLIDSRHAHRPEGDNSGTGLTDSGLKLAATLRRSQSSPKLARS